MQTRTEKKSEKNADGLRRSIVGQINSHQMTKNHYINVPLQRIEQPAVESEKNATQSTDEIGSQPKLLVIQWLSMILSSSSFCCK